MPRVLEVRPLPGYPEEIGGALWAMQAVRRETEEAAQGLDRATLDWQGADGGDNAIGTLLYHIAIVEVSWLYLDMLLLPELPPAVRADFPWAMGNGRGLTPVPGVPLADHLARLARSRTLFLEELRRMTVEDWRRLREPGDEGYRVTPEWIVFHLVEHEAGHQYQIRSIRRRAANRAD